LDKIEDDYARLVEEKNDVPRLWIDRGRRFGELQKWDDATKAFDKAAEIAPKNPQVWKERGRAYAELGKWDEAAADFVKALELPGGKNVRQQVVRLEDVFPRIAKQRPNDRQLGIDRVMFLGMSARWPEAAKTMVEVTGNDPTDHHDWHMQ